MESIWDGARIWWSGRNSALRALLLVTMLGSAAILAGGPLSAAVGADSPPVGEDSPPVGVDSPPVRVDSVECGAWPGPGLNYVVIDPSEDFAPRLSIRRDGKWVTTISPADYDDFAVYQDEGLDPALYSYEVRYRIDGEVFSVDCGTARAMSPLACYVRPNLTGTKANVHIEWQSNEPLPKIQVRRDGDWRATVSTDADTVYVDDSPGAADAAYELRYRVNGERFDITCAREAAQLPWCWSFSDVDGGITTEVWWFADETPRSYHLRRNGDWVRSVDFAFFTSIADRPEPGEPAAYSIRFRIDGQRFEVDCETAGIFAD